MSYCSELKKELCKLKDIGKREKTALLFGMLFAGRTSPAGRALSAGQPAQPSLVSGMVIQSEHHEIIDAARQLAEELFPNARHETTRRVRCGSSVYSFGFKAGEQEPFAECDSISAAVSGNDSESGAFLRGVFISCGSITDPNKGFHLELSLSDNLRAQQLFDFIGEHGIPVKTTLRTRRSAAGNISESLVIYAKESAVIEDFLTYIGAVQHTMEIMQIKVERSVRNRVNRTVNCDSANLDKTVNAANKLCEDIELIFAVNGKDSLSPQLLAAALLRLSNRESSLSELCELSDPPLSRSGLNHRFKKLTAIAEEIRSGEKSE